MAYHGYIPFVHGILKDFKNPKILEIGICDGITLFSLIQRFSKTQSSFEYTGVDILVKVPVIETLKYMLFDENQLIKIHNQNSLEFLKECREKFDIILLDGDHNYHTVYNELKLIENISHKNTIIICDDYDGRWSDKDLFYSERSEYLDNSLATPKMKSEKEGVKAAVEDFLAERPEWKKEKLMNGEPVLLSRNLQIRR